MKKLIILIAFISSVSTFFGQEAKVKYREIPDEYKEYIFASDQDMEWFVTAKFGVFVHWGPYSLAEVPASWGRLGPRPGTKAIAKQGVPLEEYDNLYKQFNPVKFDADEWIKMVKKSGAKYFVFTTKHHDGFCMFDASNTDYKITNTPFKRDIAKEIADACHKYDIKLFWYYSQPDWRHPDCLTENNGVYREYMYEHLETLLTNYGKIDGIFFDGLGTKYYDWDTPKMLKMIRTLQPEIIINKRWGAGMPGIEKSGDYDTPEQQLGVFEIDRPWETCATIAEAWSWTGGKSIKTPTTNLRMLIQSAGAGGNLLLNTGPKPNGEINQPEEEVYNFIGDWLTKNGESIYNTIGGPYEPGSWGVATRKGNKIYLHILTDFANGVSKKVELPKLPLHIEKAYILSTKEPVVVTQNDSNLIIDVSKISLDNIDAIVVLEVGKNAEYLKSIVTKPKDSRLEFVAVKASSNSKYRKSDVTNLLGGKHTQFSEGTHVKGWWAADNDDKQPWVVLTLDKQDSFNYITITEQIRNCSVRKFVVEVAETEDSDNWITLYEGEEIGMDFSVKVPEIKSKKIRLKILETENNVAPNISTLEVFKL